jgi:hypothetical protein
VDEVLGVLCALCFGLLLVAAVGHALWLGIAWFFREVLGWGEPRPSARPTYRACPSCGTAILPTDASCRSCGWPFPSPQRAAAAAGNRSAAALDALAQQIARVRELGLIDAQTHERLTAAVRAERERAEAIPFAEVVEAGGPQPAPPPLPPRPAPAPPLSPAPPSPLEPVPAAAEPTAKPASPAERARAYAARQAERAVEPQPVAEPAKPRGRPWSEVFAAFMEERHLRWGELVGGLLIVGGSIALVLSFWAQIAERPFLQFFVFNGVTAGLFGLGMYAEKRLKLPTTSHGLLIIATLLVPLNFLALSAVTRGDAPSGQFTIGGEVLSLALFAWLTFVAGKTIAAQWPAVLAAGVMGPSAAALLVRRFVASDSSTPELYVFASLPLACYLGSVGWMIWKHRRSQQLPESDAHAVFRLVGLTSFATLLPLGLLASLTGDVSGTLQRLAPLVSLAAGPALATGLLLWRRTSDALTGIRITGTTMAIFGALVLLAGVVFGWPRPSSIVPVAIVDFVVLSAVAVLFEIPAAHLLAAPCLMLAYLTIFHVSRGQVAWMATQPAEVVGALFSATSGTALVPFALVLGAGALAFRTRRPIDARFYVIIAGAAAALSLGLVTWYGFGRQGDPDGVTWVYAVYAVAALAASIATRLVVANWAGAALLLAALVQGLVYKFAQPWRLLEPWLLAMLLHSTAMLVLAAVVTWRGTHRQSRGENASFRAADGLQPFAQAALATSLIAAVMLILTIGLRLCAFVSLHALWLAVVWLALAWQVRSLAALAAGLFTAFQAALAAALVFAVAETIKGAAWAGDLLTFWLDPFSLQRHGVALAILSLGWTIVRIVLRRRLEQSVPGVELRGPSSEPPGVSVSLTRFLNPPWPACDRVVTWMLLGLLLALAVYAAWPGAAQELTPRRMALRLEAPVALTTPDSATRVVPSAAHFEWLALPHEHALQAGSWMLLALVLVQFVLRQWHGFTVRNVAACVTVLAMACPLLAGRWEGDVAVASALRWTTAAFLALASAAIWLRRPLAATVRGLGWPGFVGRSDTPSHVTDLTALVLALAVAPLVVMGAFVAIAAVADYSFDPAVVSTSGFLSVVFVIAMIAALALWLVARQPALQAKANSSHWTKQLSILLVILGAAPLVAVALYVVSAALRGNPIAGPEPGSFFHRIGLAVSYAMPLTLLALTLVGYAVRQRSARFAFAAGLLFNVSATAAYLLAPMNVGMRLDNVLWVKLGQLNATVSAAFALAWIAVALLARRTERRELPATARAGNGLLTTQTLLGPALNALLLVPGLVTLFLEPLPGAAHLELARPLGWVAVLLSMIGVVALARARQQALRPGAALAGLVSLAALVAFTLCAKDSGNWLGYHAMLVGHAAVGWLLLVAYWAWSRLRHVPELASADSDEPVRRGVTLWATLACVATVVLALREVIGYPHPWWAIGAMAAISLLAAALACWAGARGFLYAAAVLVNLATTIGWIHETAPSFRDFGEFFVELVQVNVIAVALPAVAWLLLELSVLRKNTADRPWLRQVGCHRAAAAVAILGLAGTAALGLLTDASGASLTPNVWLGWAALAAAVIATAACLWDSWAKLPAAGLYLLGLVAVAMTLDQFDLPPRMIAWTGTSILAAYAILTSYLWSRRRGLLLLADRLRIPHDINRPFAALTWLVPANGILCAVVLAAAYVIDFTFEEVSLRLLTGKAAVLQTLAIGLLARGEKRSPLQYATLCVGVIGVLAWSWAWLDPTPSGNMINRVVVAAVVLGAMTALYGLGLGKLFPRETEWTKAAGRLVPPLAALGIGAILLVLAIEASYTLSGEKVVIVPAAIAAVALTLVGLTIAALIAAVVPGRDPLGLSERGRTVYVYAAEGLLALLFLHIRLTMPWLFRGFFTDYWPFIVVLIAFVGVGLSELFRRQRRNVLADPLERTGALLPVLPVLGFWITPTYGHYSVLLLLVGVLYAVLSVTRRSFGFGLLAALAANGGLWYFLQHVEGFGLLEHPQMWLIPGAVCVLAAAYLNREQLTDQQMTTIRYLTSTTIYVSSTADIFLIGVAQNPWLPLVLAGLAIAGIFLGILLRVRAFLFLGTAFLLLAMFTIIWYAAVDLHHTWLLWLTVVIAGMLILGIFALFEKKRNEVLSVVEQIKKWEP